MIKDELFKLYEKLYFHEIDIREKFNARLQVPLAILVAQVSFLGYMLQNAVHGRSVSLLIAFWILYLLSCFSTGKAILDFFWSWYGYTFSFIPSAKETEQYHQQLIELYKEYDDTEKLVKNGIDQYLYKYYQECSSVNTENNDKKALRLHKSMSWVICAILLSFFAFIPYHFGGIDKNIIPKSNSSAANTLSTQQNATNQKENHKSNPVFILPTKSPEEVKMSEKNKQPPPPPPPPPKRMIKEGVKVVTPPPKGGKTEK
jgi:thiosulfate reductase cytochrome b subunit